MFRCHKGQAFNNVTLELDLTFLSNITFFTFDQIEVLIYIQATFHAFMCDFQTPVCCGLLGVVWK